MNATFNTRYVYRISLIAALGGYLFGFDFAVISGALPFLTTQFGLTAYLQGFTTASLALGCVAGCLGAGWISKRLGSRIALMIAALLFTVSSLLMAAAPHLTWFISARFLAGTGVGMASVLSPMYIAEIAPASVRGRMVSLNQLAIVLGILFTNIINYFLGTGGENAWRWMFASGAIPSVLFFLGIIMLPESPRWLSNAGREDKARKVLERIGNKEYVDNAFLRMRSSASRQSGISFSGLFKAPYLRPLLAGAGLAVFQQLCGINVVFNYTTVIFESIGFTQQGQLMQTVFTGIINLVFTLLAMSLVDKVGRKPLMMVGAAGLALLYPAIALALHAGSPFTSIILLAAIALYASTLAPVTWVLISEIFPGKIRETATSFSVVCLWLAYFVLTFTFPVLTEWLGDVGKTFYLYAVVCAAGTIFIYLRVKETKGIALEEMDAVFIH